MQASMRNEDFGERRIHSHERQADTEASWLGLEQVSRRTWVARLPAVLSAALILSAFVWAAGIRQEDLFYVPVILMLGLALFIMIGTFLKNNRSMEE